MACYRKVMVIWVHDKTAFIFLRSKFLTEESIYQLSLIQ